MKCLTLSLVVGLALALAAPARADAPNLLDEHALAARLTAAVESQYDSTHGGWATKEGAPIDGAIELALRLGRDPGGAVWRDRALVALEWTWAMFDTVGGGFASTARDAAPGSLSFDKLTAPNARHLECLVDAWQVTGDPLLRRRAAQTASFFDRVLSDGRGGFVSGSGGDRELVGTDNGLAIHAWLRWAAVTGDLRQKAFALKSIDRVMATCADSAFGIMRRGTFGELLKPPQLEDQVEMGRACLLAAHFCGREADLTAARALADRMLRWFEDEEKGGFLTQAYPDKKGKIRGAPRLPEENARAARFLAELASVTGDPRYREAARRTIAAFGKDLEKDGPDSAEWALAARAVIMPELPDRPTWPEAAKVDEPKTSPQSKSYRMEKTRRR